MKKAQIVTEVETCEKCPHFSSKRHYTADSFEMEFDWFCKKEEGRQIAGSVDARDKIEIPSWCPFLEKDAA